MFFLGIGLLIISILASASTQSIIPFVAGAIVAVISAFFPGYRGVFAGFIGTIGVIAFGFAIICGPIFFLNR